MRRPPDDTVVIVNPPFEFRTIVNSSVLVRVPMGVFDVLMNVPLSTGCGACARPTEQNVAMARRAGTVLLMCEPLSIGSRPAQDTATGK
jgi:carbon starvation protein CstA